MDPTWMYAALPLIGVALGAYFNERADTRRWRRDWGIQRISDSVAYFGDVTVAMDSQAKVIVQCAHAVLGRRAAVPPDRVRKADDLWGEVLARRVVTAQPELQDALTSFDMARAAAVDATNSRSDVDIERRLTELRAARIRVFKVIQADQQAMNEYLAPHLLPRRTVLARRLRRQPLAPPSRSLDEPEANSNA